MNKIVCLAGILVLAIGCAPTMTTTSLVRESNSSWSNGILEAQLPVGWGKFRPINSLLGLTKDGASLESIVIAKWREGKKLPATERRFSEDLLISEVSELVIDELSFNQELKNLQIESNEPSQVNGYDAFHVTYRFTNSKGVPYRAILYGVQIDKNVVLITYSAMRQHYYDQNLSVFEDFIKNMKINIGS